MNRSGININLLFLLLIPALAAAQEDDKEKTSFSENLEYHFTFKPKPTDAIKMDIHPVNEKLEFNPPDITYTLESAPHPTTTEFTEIPSVSLGSQKLNPIYPFYVKLGAGNYSQLFSELYFNSRRSKDINYSFYGKHYSGKGPVANSEFGEQVVSGDFTKLFKTNTLSLGGHFKNNIYHRYGYDHDSLTLPEEDVRIGYTRMGLNADFDNLRSDEGHIKYHFGIRGNLLNTYSKVQEVNFGASAEVTEMFNDNKIIITADYDYFHYASLPSSEYGTSLNYDRNIFKVDAHYRLTHELAIVTFGFKTATESDTAKSTFHFYPSLLVEANLHENEIIGFGGFGGNLDVNSLNSFSLENPFVKEIISLRNTNNKFEIFGGAKGKLSNKFSFFGKVSYKNLEDLYLFVNDPALERQFDVIYDSSTTVLFEVNASILYETLKKLKLGLNIDYFKYNMASELYAWHRPSLKYSLLGIYNISDKIIVGAEIFGYDQRQARMIENGKVKAVELDGVLDLNASITYHFSPVFGAYVNFNNILGKSYEFWNHYPVQGFHILGGLKLNIPYPRK